VALAEIELCGDLMIAASAAADGEWLSPDRIDEVLNVAPARSGVPRQPDGRSEYRRE
jgi:hypothetical protein